MSLTDLFGFVQNSQITKSLNIECRNQIPIIRKWNQLKKGINTKTKTIYLFMKLMSIFEKTLNWLKV